MPARRRLAVAALAATAVACGSVASAAAPTSAHEPVHVSATFDRGATLGGSTALAVTLRLDPRHLPTTPLTDVRFEYPGSLGLVSSGLGLATCTRPASDFAQVLIDGSRLDGCPPNAVMGYGTALAVVRLSTGQAIPEYATVTLLSGPIEDGKLKLVVFIDGQRPFGAKLAFQGEVSDAPSPYGGALDVRMPEVPGLEDVATVSLLELRLVIGSHAIRYYEHRGGAMVAYHPDGIALPQRCPSGAFRFRAAVGFADGTRRSARSRTPCPPALAAPAARR
jgi:hypothetical protein